MRKLYSAELFDPALIQTFRLIPTEYLFFYYSQQRAHGNQLKADASRGEELQRLNTELFTEFAGDDSAAALRRYREYLMRRNRSYMKLEAQGVRVFPFLWLQPDDVIEVPCRISSAGPRPKPIGDLPLSVRGLVQSVKAYERSIVIQAAVACSSSQALLGLLEYPMID